MKTTTTTNKTPARKVRATKARTTKAATKRTTKAAVTKAVRSTLPKGLQGLTQKEQIRATKAAADKLAAAADKNKRTLYANMSPVTNAVGYGKAGTRGALTGPNMSAYTVALFIALGYVKVTKGGGVTKTPKAIARDDITAFLNSSMAGTWYNATDRIKGDTLTVKGINAIEARANGKTQTKSGQGTLATTIEKIFYYVERITKGGKGKADAPFNPLAVKVSK
jgi:hypothetical protein